MACETLKDCCTTPGRVCKSRNICVIFCENRSIAQCEENRKSYSITNITRQYNIALYRIDNGVIPQHEKIHRADYMFVAYKTEGIKAVLVELKGTDVRHSIKQIDSTLSKYFDFFSQSCKNVYGRIVCASGVPDIRNDPDYLKLHTKLRKLNGNLDKKQNSYAESIESI